MPITRAGCVDPTPDYINSDCDFINSRIVAIAYGNADHGVTDWSDTVQVDAAIAAGNLGFAKFTRATPATMAAVEVTGYGKASTRVVGATHELTGVAAYNCNNIAFYNSANQGNWDFFGMVHLSGEFVTVTRKGVSLFFGKEGPEDVDGIMDTPITAKWSDKEHSPCETTVLDESYYC